MLLAALSAAIVSGCTSEIAVTGASVAAPLPAATAEPEEYGLGIIAVDFIPALEYEQIVLNGGVSLIVAVQNRGLVDETDVRVTAQLIDPLADAGDAPLLNETVTLSLIEAGKLQVVRFSEVTQLPLRESYRLEVSVEPAPGEQNTADNYRSYDIVINRGN